jgi:hypothetical protein
MKVNYINKLFIELTLDSSEAIMFNKGGKHKIDLVTDLLEQPFDSIEVSIQLERDQQARHDWIQSEAVKHKYSLRDNVDEN